MSVLTCKSLYHCPNPVREDIWRLRRELREKLDPFQKALTNLEAQRSPIAKWFRETFVLPDPNQADRIALAWVDSYLWKSLEYEREGAYRTALRHLQTAEEYLTRVGPTKIGQTVRARRILSRLIKETTKPNLAFIVCPSDIRGFLMKVIGATFFVQFHWEKSAQLSDAEFAAILAHELGHYFIRDAKPVAMLYRDFEGTHWKVDQFGMELMHKAGYPPSAFVSAYQKTGYIRGDAFSEEHLDTLQELLKTIASR